ncbi:6-phosphogluconolactonase [Arenimonas sp. MALMAid1274]|uniref:6-phosphogluconolactonase n=1 Tax=Arenimonas sp. MALMAid1274 TaxID=3411630 RepID=UPI003BA035BA
MPWTRLDHPDAETLAQACAQSLADSTRDAIRARGQAQLAIAGGRTPLATLRRWAETSPVDARVAITLTDERWVPAGHADSNLARLQACFPGDSGPRWRPLVPAEAGPVPSLATARDTLALMAAPWDVVLLGMGEDGHIASLFPTDPQLAAAMDPSSLADAAIALPQPLPPEAPHARITQTLPRLLRSHRRLLLVTGGKKRDLLGQAQQRPDPQRWPVSALLHAPGPPVEIHWSP